LTPAGLVVVPIVNAKAETEEQALLMKEMAFSGLIAAAQAKSEKKPTLV